MSETYCGACGDHAPTILGRCASCWGDRPLETALADMVLLAREAEEVRDADEEIARLTRELEEARERERGYREALERVADGGCEHFVGTDCWQMGMDPNAKDYADRVCDPCFARRALTARRGEGGE